MSELSHREEQLCRVAGSEGAKDTMRMLGINVDDPREAQQDFAWLTRMRKARDRGFIVFISVLVGLLATGVLTQLWDTITN